MIAFVKFGKNDKDQILYKCSYCGSVISHSGLVLNIDGSGEHSFVNPSGITCDFMTFSDCQNIFAYPDLFVEHSWFKGYGWRFLACEVCLQHIGWQYDAINSKLPHRFYGILTNKVSHLNAEP
jgi:hypothetical protein